MRKQWILASAGLAMLFAVLPASAADLGKTHHAAHKHSAHHHVHHHAGHRLHHGGAPGLGYWRRGPFYGKGFAFSTYKGDPFGKDDYYDNDMCFYRKGRDFCMNADGVRVERDHPRRKRYVHPLALMHG